MKFEVKDYVPASSIWPTAEDHEDYGEIQGLMRGFNIEVKTTDGTLHWLSCEYMYGSIEAAFNDEFHQWYYDEHNWTPTGRVCFRGYGVEYYSAEHRDTFVDVISDEEALNMPAKRISV